MTQAFLDRATTPSVAAARVANGSAGLYRSGDGGFIIDTILQA